MKFKSLIIIAITFLIFVSSAHSLEPKYSVSMDAKYFEQYETTIYEVLSDNNVKVKKIDELKFDVHPPLNIPKIEEFSFNETLYPFSIVKKESVTCYDDLTNIQYPVDYIDNLDRNERIISKNISRNFEFICDIKDKPIVNSQYRKFILEYEITNGYMTLGTNFWFPFNKYYIIVGAESSPTEQNFVLRLPKHFNLYSSNSYSSAYVAVPNEGQITIQDLAKTPKSLKITDDRSDFKYTSKKVEQDFIEYRWNNYGERLGDKIFLMEFALSPLETILLFSIWGIMGITIFAMKSAIKKGNTDISTVILIPVMVSVVMFYYTNPLRFMQSNYFNIFTVVGFITIIFFVKCLVQNAGKEKLKPENISSYVQEIKNLISKGDLSNADKNIKTLKDIGIAAARERDDMVFQEFLTAWFDLLMLEKIAWIQNVLENSLPDIFKIVAAEDEATAKRGLDKLQLIVLNSVEKNEIEKAKRVVGLFPWIMDTLVDTYPEIVRYSFDRLREIGQLRISISKSEEAFEVSTKSIDVLKNIGENVALEEPDLTNKAIHEISNIIHQHPTVREIVEKGINAIAGFNRDNLLVEDVLPTPNPQEVKTKANNKLLHILDSVSTGFFTNMGVKDKIEIADLIVPSIDIYSPKEASRLIIIASRFLKDDEDSAKELLNKIAKNIKEANPEKVADGIDLAKKCSSEFNWDLPIEEFERRYLKLE